MRKFLLVILSVLYLIISIGFINYKVYCQDRLVKTTIVTDNHSCDKCLDCPLKKCEKEGTCCKPANEHIQLKVDQNHSLHYINITPQQLAILDILFSRMDILDFASIGKKIYSIIGAPPFQEQIPIHFINCTYLI
ncbi:MAG: hypothetical protein E6772_17045 [Dysgonomonas sp.]|nr:hypothetical protein [Dysgonomonas sp.]